MASWPPPGFKALGEPDAEPPSTIPGILAKGANAPPKPIVEVPGGGPPDERDMYERATAATAQQFRKALPTSIADFLAESVIPQSGPDLAVWLATLPVGGKTVETLGAKALAKVMDASPAIRQGISTLLAGMVGGTLDPKSSAGQGALRSAVAIGGNKVVDKVTKMATYTPWLRRIAKEDPAEVGEALGQIIPQLGSIKSLKDFQAAFLHGYGGKKLSGEYGKALDEIGQALGNQGVNSPSYLAELMADKSSRVGKLALPSNVQQGMPFMPVIDKVRALREDGRRLLKGNQPVDAQQFFNRANNIETEALQSLPPQLAQKYKDAKLLYNKGLKILDFFDDDKLITNDGLNMQKLQEKFRSQGLSASDAVISAAEVAQFQRALFRGADSSLVTDFTPDPSTHGRAHFFGLSISPKGLFEQEKRFVGDPAKRPLAGLIKGAPFVGGRVPSIAEFLAGKRPDTAEDTERPPITLMRPEKP